MITVLFILHEPYVFEGYCEARQSDTAIVEKNVDSESYWKDMSLTFLRHKWHFLLLIILTILSTSSHISLITVSVRKSKIGNKHIS